MLDEVPRDLYSVARTAYRDGYGHIFHDWALGNIGFLASYGGRWFDGGYTGVYKEKTKNGYKLRDHYRETKNNLLAQAEELQGIDFSCDDYINLPQYFIFQHKAVIYCDPPYEGTKQYGGAGKFDHARFWEIMREWSRDEDKVVLISEQNAPDDFECIWEQEVDRAINRENHKRNVERLFKYKG